MSQYDIKNAAERVEGYFILRPGECDEKAFERAKVETVINMKNALAQTEALTFDQWKSSLHR